jgi:hypothetical protein
MYLVVVVALMLVLPLTSSVIALDGPAPEPVAAVLVRWFVFWGVGVRLLLAGVRQIVEPRYTAEEILGIESEPAHAVIRELGFANVALGTVGMASLFARAWAEPAGLAGAAFGGLLAMLTVGVRR